MSETFDIYTLLFLIIAVIIFLRLRSVLGRRTGNERPPYDPYSASETNTKPTTGKQDNVVHLPRNDDNIVVAHKEEDIPSISERLKDFAPEGTPLAEQLTKIIQTDRAFDPAQFLNGAKIAYEIIVMAFADGDKRALKPLLNKEVYEGFVSAIEEREERGEKIDSSFVGINKATIIDADLKNNWAHVTVKFVSELSTAVRNKLGDVIEGDPKRIREVTDIWTFARNTKSSDPNWKLMATESAN